jgi:hypothetical protein
MPNPPLAAAPRALLCVPIAFWLCLFALVATPAIAQRSETLRADLTFYADNTEFSNPFREGETLFGVFGRIFVDVLVSDTVSVEGGVFANQRLGSSRAFDDVRPVFALVLGTSRQRFRFGTLNPQPSTPAFGPDRQGQHGLLPPLQAETVALSRPWEAGLQWTASTPRVAQEAWINWQLLNTDRQRERFDTGVTGTVRVRPGVALGYQWHLVHRGGQLFASGPVSDSQAVALGPRLAGRMGGLDEAAVEVWGLLSRDVPDRERDGETRSGEAFLVKASGRSGGWRGHVLAFRGCDFLKAEGDPNYLSIRLDGRRFRRVRDYAEAGIARRFDPAPRVSVEASFRLHRTENHYEYSYRVLGRVGLAWPLR